MIGVRLRAVLDTEVVHDERERDIEGVMLKETRCLRALVIAVSREMRDQT